jgi:hypothetical protein
LPERTAGADGEAPIESSEELLTLPGPTARALAAWIEARGIGPAALMWAKW